MSILLLDRGDDEVYDITCKKPDGTALDLTGCTLYFRAKRHFRDADVDAVIIKSSPATGIVISAPPTEGLAVLTIAAADSIPLDLRGEELPFTLKVKDGAGKVTTLDRGTLKAAAVTQAAAL